MREIKFRAWSNYEQKYYYNIGLINDNIYADLGDNYGDENWQIIGSVFDDDFIIEQYTGIKDRKGFDIYEGDTIKYQDRNYSEVFGQGDVYYDDDDCMFKIRCNNVILFFMNLLNEELEVVGNIHNKEKENDNNNS